MPTLSTVLSRLARFTPVLAMVAVGAVYAAVTWHSSAPVFYNDEMGTLGSARLFADPTTTWLLPGSSYMPGFAVLVTPLWWISSDPQVVYRLAITLGAVLSVASVVPLARIAHHWGASRNASWWIGAAIMVAPARALNADYVWAEQLLFFLVAWCVWRILCLDAANIRAIFGLGLAAGGAFATHGRALPFTVLVVLGGAWLLRRSWRAIGALGLGAALTAGIGYALFTYARAEIYVASDRASATLEDIAGVTPANYAETLVSQWWYQTAAWAGLTVAGAVVLVVMARRERFRGASTVVLAIAAGMALATPALIAGSAGLDMRLDVHFYGRYADPFVAVLAAAALARLMHRVQARWSIAYGGGAVAAALAFLFIVAPGIPAGLDMTPIHVAGVAYLLHPVYTVTGQSENWALVAFVGVAAAVAIALCSTWRRSAIVVAALYFATMTLWTDLHMFDHYEEGMRTQPATTVPLDHLPEGVPLYADYTDRWNVNHGNRISFWVSPRDFIYMDQTKDTSDVEMFLGTTDSAFARGRGGRPLEGSVAGGRAVWILQGPLQDALAQAGALEELPETATP